MVLKQGSSDFRCLNFKKVFFVVSLLFGISFVTRMLAVGEFWRCNGHLLPTQTTQQYIGKLLQALHNVSQLNNIHGTEQRELLGKSELILKRILDLEDKKSKENGKTVKGSCTPHRHIFFLKTHKTGSSTIMNILFRFGDLRNLSFAHPTNGNSQFNYPSYFSSRFVDGFVPGNCSMFHIMCQHMRFQFTEVDNVMPRDTFYFTILRNPISQMESSFSYYKSIGVFSKAKSLEDFLHNASKYYESKGLSRNYAKNLMMFDMGLNPDGISSNKNFQLNWRTVETIFDLVLITDYFDESLVLLKDALCWTLEDVLSFPLNTRSNSTKKNLSKETQDMIKSWNELDWQLYVYFNHSFWNRVDMYGREKMQREVEELRKLRAQISMTCLEGEVDPEKMQDKSLKPYQSGIARILGYNLKPALEQSNKLMCQRMVTPELQYTKLLVQKQSKSKYYCIEKKESIT
ncbi:galactose-3-O-sulfotransferase 2 [Xenopus laevis]|uniref:Galactose-3-O-sulfotransferase 2 n=2 Tax=Xenopus laevis TaxID=8355 RepID=A0A1L8GB73_XENLA|nr:galactose-3-O-sulfotransferase 2 [Xenopus laevis]OCT81118.1 hypothetical protein XELAEV_18027931mg [Xenopus laevis]